MVFTWFMFNVFMSWGFLPLLRSQDYSDLPQLWMSISDVEYELNFVYCCLWRRRRSNDQLLQLSLASFDMSMAFPRTTTTTLGASVWSSQTSSRSGGGRPDCPCAVPGGDPFLPMNGDTIETISFLMVKIHGGDSYIRF